VRNSPRSPPGHRRAGLFCVDHFEARPGKSDLRSGNRKGSRFKDGAQQRSMRDFIETIA
jgi:hypothetical protein